MPQGITCWDSSGNQIMEPGSKCLKLSGEGSVGFDRIYFNVANGNITERTMVTGYAYINNNRWHVGVTCTSYSGGFYCALPPFSTIPGWSSGITGTLYYKFFNY